MVGEAPAGIAPASTSYPSSYIAEQATVPVPAVPRSSPLSPAAPSIAYGDLQQVSIPRDAAGRLVLVVAVILALDLEAPWIAFDGTSISPARFVLPALLVAALLLAAAASVVYSPLRRNPYAAVYPVVLGAAAFGAAATLTLMVGPFAPALSATFVAHVLAAPVVVQNLANPDPVLSPPTIALAADTGLYVFLLGSAILAAAAYQRVVRSAAALAGPAVAPASTVGAGRTAFDGAADAPTHPERAVATASGPTSAADRGELPASPPTPAAEPPGVVLPGSSGWDRPSDAPLGRSAPNSRGLPLGR